MVYVDNMRREFGFMKMCHMIADSAVELLVMADAIGIERRWLQCKGTRHEHFDICASKKKLAIKFGAKQIDNKELAKKLKKVRP